jgi:mRNA interferase MazF
MVGMKRGDFVTIALQSEFGKPRPALVLQSNQFSELLSITVLLVSSSIIDAPLMRITVTPDMSNGLQKISQIMIDKCMTVKKEKIGSVLGSVSNEIMVKVDRSLAVFLGIV